MNEPDISYACKLMAQAYQPTNRHEAINNAVECADLVNIFLSAALLGVRDRAAAQQAVDKILEHIETGVKGALNHVHEQGGPKSPFEISEVNEALVKEIMEKGNV